MTNLDLRTKMNNRKLPVKKSRSVLRRSPVKKSRSVNRKIMLKGGGGGKLVDCPARCVDGFYAYSVDGHRINNGVPCPVCRDTGQIPSDVLDIWMKNESYRLYFVQTPNYQGKISIYDFKKLANDYGRDTGGGCLDYISENRSNLVLSPDATEEFLKKSLIKKKKAAILASKEEAELEMYTFCPASCNGGLEQGGVNDRSDDTISKRCNVCIGSKFPGRILTSELECWKEDPIYSQYLSKTRDTARSYVEYYTDIHSAYEIKEYINGRFPTLSLSMFINNARRIAECAHICSSVTAIAKDDSYEIRSKQKQVTCPCECINGTRLSGYYGK